MIRWSTIWLALAGAFWMAMNYESGLPMYNLALGNVVIALLIALIPIAILFVAFSILRLVWALACELFAVDEV